MVDRDEIEYVRSGDVAIAYAVHRDGPRDLVFVHGFAGSIEIDRENPRLRAFEDGLAGFSRVITFDRRGTGLSDRLREPARLEARMDDLRAVLDAADSERAVLFGTFEAASMCLLFGRNHSKPRASTPTSSGRTGAPMPKPNDGLDRWPSPTRTT